MNKPLKLNNIIGSGRLSGLLARARALTRLEQQLQPLLPDSLRPYCHVLAVRDKTLILAADSPVWAARLRFLTPQLQQQLKRITQLDRIRVRVRPPARETPRPSLRRPGQPRSGAGSDALLQAARTVSDPALKSALLKLAGRKPGA